MIKKRRPEIKRIIVTIQQEYLISMSDETHSFINGWTIEQIIEDWFVNHNINDSHATRDSHHTGGGDQFLDYKVEELE